MLSKNLKKHYDLNIPVLSSKKIILLTNFIKFNLKPRTFLNNQICKLKCDVKYSSIYSFCDIIVRCYNILLYGQTPLEDGNFNWSQ